MTGTNDKVRSLFLAGLMVMSVFAMTVAFSGGAVADTAGNSSISSVSFDSGQTLNASDAVSATQTQNISLTVSENDTEIEEYSVDLSDLGDDLTIDDVTVNAGTNLNVSSSWDSDAQNFAIGADGGTDVNQGTVWFNVTYDLTDAENDNSVEIVFSGEDDSSSATGTFRVTGPFSTKVQQGDADAEIFREETVQFDATGTQTTVRVYETDSDGNADTQVATLSTTFSDKINYDTSNLDAGQDYIVGFAGETDPTNSGATNLTVNALNLDVEADSTSVTNEDSITATATSSDPSGNYVARLLDSDDDTVTSKTGSFDGAGDADISFGSQDTGNYTVEVEHNDTAITAESDEIEVTEAGDASASFAEDVVVEQQGDIAQITVELDNTDTGTVTIGSASQNYWIRADVDDSDDGDGEVTLNFNTYTAGAGAMGEFSKLTAESDDDSVTIVDEGGAFTNSNDVPSDKLLGATEYEMNVTGGSDYTDQDDVGSLSVRARSTDSINTWVTPEDTDFGGLEVADVYDNLESSITETEDVANGDIIVHQITASGLEGLSANESGFLNAVNTSAIDLAIEETEGGVNVDPATYDVDGSNAAVIEDPDNNTYFVATATNDLSGSLSEGTDYMTNFSVNTAGSLNGGDDNQVVTGNFSLVEPSGSLDTNDDDEVVVQSATAQEITGSTNYAPGTEMRVKIESETSTSPFFAQPTGTVQPDGDFTVTQDMTDVGPDTELTLTLQRSNADDDGLDSFDGVVQEGPTGSVSFSDQTTDGSSVTVDSVTLSEGGFVAIHANNASGDIIGSSDYLESGNSEDVEVTLDEPLDNDSTVVAMAHQDTNDNEAFDYDGGSTDAAYTSDGSAVTASANITVDADATEATEDTEDTEETEATEDTEATEETEATEDTEDTGTTETTTGDGPGFGVVVSLIALIAAALLAVRRDN